MSDPPGACIAASCYTGIDQHGDVLDSTHLLFLCTVTKACDVFSNEFYYQVLVSNQEQWQQPYCLGGLWKPLVAFSDIFSVGSLRLQIIFLIFSQFGCLLSSRLIALLELNTTVNSDHGSIHFVVSQFCIMLNYSRGTRLLPSFYLEGGFCYHSVTLQNDHFLLCCEVFFFIFVSLKKKNKTKSFSSISGAFRRQSDKLISHLVLACMKLVLVPLLDKETKLRKYVQYHHRDSK